MRDELQEVDDRGREDARGGTDSSTAGQGRYVVPFPMTREEVAAAMELGHSQLAQLVAECAPPNATTNAASSSSWTRVNPRKKTGVALWEKRVLKGRAGFQKPKKSWRPAVVEAAHLPLNPHHGHESLVYSVRSSVTVNAPLETILTTLDASVATAHRSFIKIIYGNLVADTSVLFHSAGGSDFSAQDGGATGESLAVRWLVCRCSKPMASDCDMCLQEYTKWHSIDELAMNKDYYNNNKNWPQDGSKRNDGLHAADEVPVAYKLFQSMETRHCPELLDSHRVVRCKIPMGGFLLYPTDSSDKTDVVFYMSIAQDRGSAPATAMLTQCSDRQFRALQQVLRQMALNMERLENAADAYLMSLRLESLQASRWVRNAERSECVVCFRRFHQLTRRRHHCRLCGEVICRECSVQKDVDLPTSGPTVLRICSPCDHRNSSLRPRPPCLFARSEPSITASTDDQRTKVEDVREEELVATNATASENPPRRRRSTIGADNTERDKEARERADRRFAAAMEEAHQREVLKQATSYPQSAASPVIDRRYFANKWSGNRLVAATTPPVVTTAPNTPATKSNSKESATREQGKTRFWSDSSRMEPQGGRLEAQNNDSEDEDKFASPEPRREGVDAGLKSRYFQTPAPSARATNPVVSTAKSGDQSNQVPEHSARVKLRVKSREQDKPLVHRSFETLEQYEDIFLQLCEDAAAVRSSKFAALTLFSASMQHEKSQPNETETKDTAIHYLKVRGSAKLMKVAANLRCCEPVLQLQKPVVTRNTCQQEPRTSLHPSGYDFRKLPIVSGPQQARFYAGVPLIDSKKRFRYGALAVFDAGIHHGEDDDVAMKMTVRTLQTRVRDAVAAMDERRKELELRSFLQTPLVQLRQSEPALHLSMELERGSSRWYDVVAGEQESLDGDSDAEEDIAEARRRLEHEDDHEYARADPEEEYSAVNSAGSGKSHVEFYRNKMQELVQQAQETQAQLVEHSVTMERHGVPII
ncbi:hypothetical protein BBJ28_00000758 [Nothophytophthora sp. Chile5]|nr:hypothetical protein BBJ28_00000758 [Nothophytophthora sp. Chile5]